jgi:hypothetical protein
LIFALVPLVAAGPAAAQITSTTVTVEGAVSDAVTGLPLAGALVLLANGSIATTADSLGRFRLDLPTGVHRLIVQQYGYSERAVAVTVPTAPGPLAIALTPDPVAIEELSVRAGRSVALAGVVVDATTGARLPGATVLLERENRGALSDSAGAFLLADLTAGDHLLLVRQFGYESLYVGVRVTGGEERLEIPLQPAALVLEGLTVEVMANNVATMMQRLRSRRNAAPVNVRALDQDRLLRTAASNLIEFLQLEAFVFPVACSGSGFSSTQCIIRRGRMTEPRVFIDENPVIGGLDQLATYRPHDFVLLEVWSRGATIRAYTHQFMERMAQRPMQLIPGW